VDTLATSLAGLGVCKGDTVGILLPNSIHYVIAYFAILKIGAVVTPINPLYKADEIEYIAHDAETKILITIDIAFDQVSRALSKTPIKTVIGCNVADFLPLWKQIIAKCTHKIPCARLGANVLRFTDLLHTRARVPKVKLNIKEDLAVLQYTAGTTGKPKAAMLTHRNIVANAQQIAAWISKSNTQRDITVGVIPLFHVYGMTTVMNFTVITTNTMVLFPKLPRDLGDLLKAIMKYRATLFPGVPALYNAINNYNRVKEYDLSSLTCCISGASPLPAKVESCFEKLTRARLVEGYGLSEASPVTHVNPVYGLCKSGTIGIPVPDTDAKIVDQETGERELKPNEVGELIVRGPQVMKGYYKHEQETKTVLRNDWLYTGDLGLMDEDGFFTIVERKKDVINRKGFSVFPAEVESMLYKNEHVLECAVIGISDDKAGEEIKAFIVLKDQSQGKVSETNIIEWAKANMGATKYPRMVEFCDEIPKNAAGKILRRVLYEKEISNKEKE
jgi:long-chain acyl-CoA synthetase